ncbi:hypothetical protein [Dechloromonas hortensis]|uniref:hypothetical protein n=1 Tax=Dechloromonas hortensis TaxID=337779 RepID=UPI0012915086|nr:hypothetical protein [Dechloromonas hortensis]
MTTNATVAFFKNEFVAELSTGQKVAHAELRDMAYALYCAGVHAADIQFEWQAGQRMITAGQQAALRAEINRLQREHSITPTRAFAA